MWRIPQENCTQDIIVPRKFPRNYPKEGCPLGNCLTENCLPPIDLLLFNSPKYVVLTQLLQSYNLVDSPLGGLILAVELPVYFSRYSWLLQNFFLLPCEEKMYIKFVLFELMMKQSMKNMNKHYKHYSYVFWLPHTPHNVYD